MEEWCCARWPSEYPHLRDKSDNLENEFSHVIIMSLYPLHSAWLSRRTVSDRPVSSRRFPEKSQN